MIFTKTRESSVPRMGKKWVRPNTILGDERSLINNHFGNGPSDFKQLQSK